MNFWDANEFLMMNDQVSCTIEKDLQNLDFLDPNQLEEDHSVKKGSIIKLPIWAALVISDDESGKINEPLYLSNKFYDQLIADPTVVNLRNKNYYFYDISLILIPHLDSEKDWNKLIWDSLFDRYHHLLINSRNIIYENTSIQKLLCHREIDFYSTMIRKYQLVRYYTENYLMTEKTPNEAKYTRRRKKLIDEENII